MLISLLILYPLCKKNYDIFTRVVAPIVGIFIVGYLCAKFGYLSGASEWGVFMSKVQLRGIAEICIGAFVFEISRFISKYSFSKIFCVILSVIEYGCYVGVLIFSCLQISIKYEAYALYALAVAVCLSFSGITYGGKLFQNRAFMFLGKLSLSIYLMQTCIRLLVQHFCGNTFSITTQFILILMGIFSSLILVHLLGNVIKKRMELFMENAIQSVKW